MNYATGVLVKHCAECAFCSHAVSHVTMGSRSFLVSSVHPRLIASCIAQNEGIAPYVQQRLVSMRALTELVEAHVRKQAMTQAPFTHLVVRYDRVDLHK